MPKKVVIITGDHGQRDSTKWDGGYTEDDIALHDQMVAAFRSWPDWDFDVITDHGALMPRMQNDPPEFVVNFCDTGFNNQAHQELHVPALLELYGVPYTGAGPQSMVLCYDKALVRLLAESIGLPVPQEHALGPRDALPDNLAYPLIIKPTRGDGSVGINQNAVVHNDGEAQKQLEWFRQTLPNEVALLQEYLPGAEYGLALIGNPQNGFTMFPPLVVDYSALPSDLSPILAFESKTGPDSDYAKITVKQADLSDDTQNKLRGYAERLFERLGCRDYARFDFRTAADGTIKLMEVNPNPAWSGAAKLALMARFAGLEYRDLLRLLLTTAIKRTG